MKGVVKTVVGYTGGQTPNPCYRDVKKGNGHTECIAIQFDPALITYEVLLAKFFKMHDPFRQKKEQYMSAIFATSENQINVAEREADKLDARTGGTVSTVIEPLRSWTEAEERHQKYYEKKENKRAQLMAWGKMQKRKAKKFSM